MWEHKLLIGHNFGPLSTDTGDWGRKKFRFILTRESYFHLGFGCGFSYVSIEFFFFHIELNWR